MSVILQSHLHWHTNAQTHLHQYQLMPQIPLSRGPSRDGVGGQDIGWYQDCETEGSSISNNKMNVLMGEVEFKFWITEETSTGHWACTSYSAGRFAGPSVEQYFLIIFPRWEGEATQFYLGSKRRDKETHGMQQRKDTSQGGRWMDSKWNDPLSPLYGCRNRDKI